MKETSKGNPSPSKEWLDAFIRSALAEDLGEGDRSTLACIPGDAKGKARLLIKEEAVLAGLDLAERILQHLDPNVRIDRRSSDGEKLEKGAIALEAEGQVHALLAGERLILNCLQRMSGIATLTASYVEQVQDLPVKINDTRKTTPGLRPLEKWAVRIGGGVNHRHGLYDMVLLKDNHIDHAGGVEKALQATMDHLEKHQLKLPVEVEARDLDEVDRILKSAPVDRIMLDNFSYADSKEAVTRIDGKALTEASGGIDLETVRAYAECGVDFISVGALTHSPPSVDMSFKASG